MYHTEPPTDKTIREWYMNSSRVAACALRNEQAVRAHRPGRPVRADRDLQVSEFRHLDFQKAIALNIAESVHC